MHPAGHRNLGRQCHYPVFRHIGALLHGMRDPVTLSRWVLSRHVVTFERITGALLYAMRDPVTVSHCATVYHLVAHGNLVRSCHLGAFGCDFGVFWATV